MTIELVIAFWGAVLSTLLALIKIWEIYQARLRISISHSLSPGENEIFIENISPKPLMITYWELELVKRGFCNRSVVSSHFPDDGYYHVTVGAYERHTIHFVDENWFDWSHSKMVGHYWRLKIYVAGRNSPATFKVYPKKQWFEICRC